MHLSLIYCFRSTRIVGRACDILMVFLMVFLVVFLDSHHVGVVGKRRMMIRVFRPFKNFTSMANILYHT